MFEKSCCAVFQACSTLSAWRVSICPHCYRTAAMEHGEESFSARAQARMHWMSLTEPPSLFDIGQLSCESGHLEVPISLRSIARALFSARFLPVELARRVLIQ